METLTKFELEFDESCFMEMLTHLKHRDWLLEGFTVVSSNSSVISLCLRLCLSASSEEK